MSSADLKSDLLQATIPLLGLSPEEDFAITEESNHLINDTIASHDEYLAYGRTLPKYQRKLMKTKGALTAFRTRRNFESLTPNLPQVKTNGSIFDRFRSSTLEVDTTSSEYSDPSSGSSGSSSWSSWSSTGSMSSVSESWSVLGSMNHLELSQMPMVVVTGIIPGTLEDAAYGNIADNPAVWKLRSTYTKDLHHRCKILATLRGPSKADPYRFLGVKWSLKKLPAFLSMCDMVYTESAGVIRDENGNITTGDNLMHSIELPGIPQLALRRPALQNLVLLHHASTASQHPLHAPDGRERDALPRLPPGSQTARWIDTSRIDVPVLQADRVQELHQPAHRHRRLDRGRWSDPEVAPVLRALRRRGPSAAGARHRDRNGTDLSRRPRRVWDELGTSRRCS
ncbi:hypothetical protein FI667_g8061, partial [Globisporangium splendens]